MAGVVLDASAVLALLCDEPGAAEVASVVEGAIMSVVNWAEVASFYVQRGTSIDIVEAMRHELPLEFVKATYASAIAAGTLRRPTVRAGLSLGDRFCLALAQERGLPAMTADKPWGTIAQAVGVDIRLIR